MDLFLFSLGFVGGIVFLVLLVINIIKKRPKKNALIGLAICFVLFIAGICMIPVNPGADLKTKETTGSKVKVDKTEKDIQDEKVKVDKTEKKEKTKKKPAQKKAKTKQNTKQKKTVTKAKQRPKTLEEIVQQKIISKAGKETNREVGKVRKITVNDNLGTEVEGDKIVLAHLNANDNFSAKMIKGKILMESTSIFKELFRLNKVSEVTLFWYFPMIDKYGNEEDDVILKVGLTKDIADKINWKNFIEKDLEYVSEQYFVHPAFNK